MVPGNILKYWEFTEWHTDCLLFVIKPGALRPVTTATLKALTCFCLFGLWPKIQATRFAGGS